MNHKPTEEQKKIVRSYKQNDNIRIEANAGSGKTSTCMYLAQADEKKQILLLTFNRQLANESKERFKGMENVRVQTVHGFIKGMYNQEGYDTQMLLNVYVENIRPLRSSEHQSVFSSTVPGSGEDGVKKEERVPRHFDVLILDEFQDFSQLMVKLIFKSLYWINRKAQIVILGSYPQCIYQFFEADERCLKYCTRYLVENGRKWKTLKLTESFRLTKKMQMFMNKVVLDNDHFGVKEEERREGEEEEVILWIGDPYDRFSEWFYENIAKKYKPEQIFILAPSVVNNDGTIYKKSDSAIVRLQKYLTKRDYEFYVIDTMLEKVEDEYSDKYKSITKGKTIISSYHSAKGCERDVVVVFNFDTTYFKYYVQDKRPEECTNAQYVALTRAKKKLVLLQNNNKMLQFIRKDRISEYCKILEQSEQKKEQQEQKQRSKKTKILGITNLIKSQKPKDIMYMQNIYIYEKISKYPDCTEKLHNRVSGKKSGRYEDVSDFNGNICTLYLQYIKTGRLPEFREENTQQELLKVLIKKVNQQDMEIRQKLYYIVQIMYIQHYGYTHRLSQIRNWIKEYHLEQIERQFEHYIEKENIELEFEKRFIFKVKIEDIQRRNVQINYERMQVVGFIDVIDKKNKKIIEIKYVKQLQSQHYQQLFFYYLLLNLVDQTYKDYTYEIFNVKQGQVYQLKLLKNIQNPKDLMYRIIRSKFEQQELSMSDKEFVEDIQKYFSFVKGNQLQYDLERQLQLDD